MNFFAAELRRIFLGIKNFFISLQNMYNNLNNLYWLKNKLKEKLIKDDNFDDDAWILKVEQKILKSERKIKLNIIIEKYENGQ